MRATYDSCCLLFSIVVALPALGQTQQPSSKPSKVQPVEVESISRVKDFNYIHLLGTGKLHIRQAEMCGVAVKVPKGLSGVPRPYVKGNVLIIPDANGIPALPAVIPNLPKLPALPKADILKLATVKEPVEYTIDVKDLKGIVVAGSGLAEADGIRSKELQVSITGSGSLLASGSADSLLLSLAGVGNFDGKNLKTQIMQIKHPGFGKAIVNVQRKLDVTITGTGSVEYIGSPTVRKSISGPARLVKIADK
jgi:Putative auto-transporter adhesin, head GIN domain